MLELLIYMISMAITPGPNTIMSMVNASEKGLRKGLFLNYGMFVGITIIDILTFVVISFLINLIPSIINALKCLGIVYLLYLAIHLLCSKEKIISSSSGNFLTGMMMQFANVKVMLLCFSAQSVYIIGKEHELFRLMLIPIVCFLSGLVWAVAGSFLSKLYKSKRNILNIIFSSSLFILAFLNIFELLKEIG